MNVHEIDVINNARSYKKYDFYCLLLNLPTVNVFLAVCLWILALHYYIRYGFNIAALLAVFGYHFHSDDLVRLDQSQREMIEKRFKSRKTALR